MCGQIRFQYMKLMLQHLNKNLFNFSVSLKESNYQIIQNVSRLAFSDHWQVEQSYFETPFVLLGLYSIEYHLKFNFRINFLHRILHFCVSAQKLHRRFQRLVRKNGRSGLSLRAYSAKIIYLHLRQLQILFSRMYVPRPQSS